MAMVSLICMPYQNLNLSSLSISLLGSVLHRAGVGHDQSYLHFEFARLAGTDVYNRVSRGGTKTGLIGEMLFAEDYHGHAVDYPHEAVLSEMFGDRGTRRALIERFREVCVSRLDQEDVDVIAITTSINQLLPAIWLAKLSKTTWPERRTVLGGSGCTVPMGSQILASYPEVDFVVSGYGEEPLLRIARDQQKMKRGLILNESAINLDDLPIPDYTAFLDQLDAFYSDRSGLMLAFESSRGCWWGEKHHCRFCGLNSNEMKFNTKSARRVSDEIKSLWQKHGLNLFATDSIMARCHLKKVVPELQEMKTKPRIFYEIKANMKAKDVESLREGNITWVQPGIESLSTKLLKLLGKGVSAIQNVALLKWCREQRITVSWNLLCGIPGEALEDYAAQIDLMERIPHLPPPGSVSPIRIDRYSPYFTDHASFGWVSVRPMPEYAALHPHMEPEALHKVAYHFDAFGGDVSVTAYLSDLQAAVDRWQARNAAGAGLYWDRDDALYRIHGTTAERIQCSRTLVDLLEATHEVTPLDEVLRIPGVDRSMVDDLAAAGIIYTEREGVLNLTVRLPN